MIRAYINYPVPHVTTHSDAVCSFIQSQHKANQRLIKININTLTKELRKFVEKEYRFAATPEFNDMWLDIDFNDEKFEIAVIEFIAKLLGKRYKPFASIEPNKHC